MEALQQPCSASVLPCVPCICFSFTPYLDPSTCVKGIPLCSMCKSLHIWEGVRISLCFRAVAQESLLEEPHLARSRVDSLFPFGGPEYQCFFFGRNLDGSGEPNIQCGTGIISLRGRKSALSSH